jgi:Rv0078B-related antitoxin
VTAANVEKFRVVFDLCDAGVRIYRQRIRHENPAASEEESGIEDEVVSRADLPEALPDTFMPALPSIARTGASRHKTWRLPVGSRPSVPWA